MNNGLTNLNVRSLTFLDTNLFVATLNGVFLSMNNATSWDSVNTGLRNSNVIALTVSDGYLFAGISGRGVWRRSLSEMTTSVENPETVLPAHFRLEQNYPNPFNPNTRIDYYIPQTAFVSIKVYDILGREVAQLVHEIKQPGSYSLQFDGMNLPSGVYFYSITAGEFHQVKKMILMK